MYGKIYMFPHFPGDIRSLSLHEILNGASVRGARLTFALRLNVGANLASVPTGGKAAGAKLIINERLFYCRRPAACKKEISKESRSR